jgi:hypothetical protein
MKSVTIQTDMFMHTNVCTVRESNPRPVRSRRVFPPLRHISRPPIRLLDFKLTFADWFKFSLIVLTYEIDV